MKWLLITMTLAIGLFACSAGDVEITSDSPNDHIEEIAQRAIHNDGQNRDIGYESNATVSVLGWSGDPNNFSLCTGVVLERSPSIGLVVMTPQACRFEYGSLITQYTSMWVQKDQYTFNGGWIQLPLSGSNFAQGSGYWWARYSNGEAEARNHPDNWAIWFVPASTGIDVPPLALPWKDQTSNVSNGAIVYSRGGQPQDYGQPCPYGSCSQYHPPASPNPGYYFATDADENPWHLGAILVDGGRTVGMYTGDYHYCSLSWCPKSPLIGASNMGYTNFKTWRGFNNSAISSFLNSH